MDEMNGEVQEMGKGGIGDGPVKPPKEGGNGDS
jgi:hypothetical protein